MLKVLPYVSPVTYLYLLLISFVNQAFYGHQYFQVKADREMILIFLYFSLG